MTKEYYQAQKAKARGGRNMIDLNDVDVQRDLAEFGASCNRAVWNLEGFSDVIQQNKNKAGFFPDEHVERAAQFTEAV